MLQRLDGSAAGNLSSAGRLLFHVTVFNLENRELEFGLVQPRALLRCAALCCTMLQVSGSRWLWQLQTRRSDTGRPRQVLVVALPPPTHQAAPVDLDLLDCLQQVISSPKHCALLLRKKLCGDILLQAAGGEVCPGPLRLPRCTGGPQQKAERVVERCGAGTAGSRAGVGVICWGCSVWHR